MAARQRPKLALTVIQLVKCSGPRLCSERSWKLREEDGLQWRSFIQYRLGWLATGLAVPKLPSLLPLATWHLWSCHTVTVHWHYVLEPLCMRISYSSCQMARWGACRCGSGTNWQRCCAWSSGIPPRPKDGPLRHWGRRARPWPDLPVLRPTSCQCPSYDP
jgi:hypothetical protein